MHTRKRILFNEVQPCLLPEGNWVPRTLGVRENSSSQLKRKTNLYRYLGGRALDN